MEQYIFLTLLTIFAAFIGTITGFGLSTIMIPAMLLFYPLPLTLLFVGIIHLFGDVWKIILFKRGANWKLILAFGIPGILFSYLGASISLTVSPLLLKRLLGAFLLMYVVFLLYKTTWKIPETGRTSILGGSLSGFFAGIFGVGGAIRSAFLSVYNLPKEVFIFTSGMIALFIDITRVSKYIMGGLTVPTIMLYFLALLIPCSLLGAYFSKKILHKIPQNKFRIVIAIMLGIMSLKFIIFP